MYLDSQVEGDREGRDHSSGRRPSYPP
jgi:hypothetical protein